MSASAIPGRNHRLNLALVPVLFAILFGQVTVEKVRALLGGHEVTWSEKYGVLLSGWSFVVVTGALTLLAIWSAYETWRSSALAWVLLAILWFAIAFIGAIHTFGQVHIATLKVMYMIAFVAMGVVLTIAVRRLAAEARPNKSLERTREG